MTPLKLNHKPPHGHWMSFCWMWTERVCEASVLLFNWFRMGIKWSQQLCCIENLQHFYYLKLSGPLSDSGISDPLLTYALLVIWHVKDNMLYISIHLFFRWLWNLVDHALQNIIHEKKIFQATHILTTHNAWEHYPQF